eukprot:TRINITY_DN40143_c0_g1_i1.p1 TRINITY_DN40143_c0_g1~~TRINITY_DN40143_c0_g1_i1.p1  ORF type:complete len:340 (+),score=76.54 TRINITY_DN40143_c0_g1_i1:80-1099(+)
MVEEANDKYSDLRTKFFTESLEASNEPRWGYFGIPGSLSIGDNSYAPRLMKKPPAEDEGDPICNMKTNPTKKGSGTDVYFRFETPLAIGDLYQDPGAATRKGKITMLDPDAVFKPPGSLKESTNKLGYEYVPHKDGFKDPKAIKEKYTDYVPLRNIYSGPTKKGGGGVLTGGVLFGFEVNGEVGKFPEHVPDDYDSAKKQRKKELEEHNSKVQECPFKGIDYGNRDFHPYIDVYGGYEGVPTHVPRDPPPNIVQSYPHESAFKPSNPMKKGMLGSLMGGIPEWMPDPPKEAVRKAPVEDAPVAFKVGAPRQVCNPTPSVTTLTRNMRAERPSSFMRPCL